MRPFAKKSSAALWFVKRYPLFRYLFVLLNSHTGAGIALHQLPPHIAGCIELKNPPQWREHTDYKVCFETEALEAQRQRILAHGGQAKDPWQWGGTRFCECTDPEGNMIQIFMGP